MRQVQLKRIRIGFAIAIFGLATIAFLGQAQISQFLSKILIQIQFVPALIRMVSGTGILFVLILIITLIFGRVYCSFLCPLGIFQDLLIRLSFKLGITRKHRPIKSFAWLQYMILGLTISALMFGSFAMVNLLDPYTIFGKFVVQLIKPVALFFNNILVEILELFDIFHISIKRGSEIPIGVLAVTLMLSGVISLLSIFWGRLFCNSVCPVGLNLGKLSQFSLFKCRIDTQNCQKCRLCEKVCKAGCINAKNHTIDHSRCLACFNCLTACKKGLISYSRRIQPVETNPVRLKRQFLLNSFLAGGILLSAYTPFRMRRWGLLPEKMPVLPPGSLSIDHFTRTCTACQLCISVCTTHVMKPTLTEYGLSGIMLPQLSFQKAHCDYECTACGNICPTGAITPLPSETKKLTRIGKAVLNLDACIVHSKKNRCGACGEACPTHAISPRVENHLIFPQINSDYCIGCGACEHACPAKPKAILIQALSVQETAIKYTPLKGQKKINEIPASSFPF